MTSSKYYYIYTCTLFNVACLIEGTKLKDIIDTEILRMFRNKS